jgi:hypothetical protein
MIRTTLARWREQSANNLRALGERLSTLWLFGTLFKCSAPNFLNALYEFTHGIVFATMPFWLGGLVVLVLAPAPAGDDTVRVSDVLFWMDRYWSSIVSTFAKGELLVFAISLLSPTLWLATYEPKGADMLPHRRPVSTLAVIVIVVGAVLFGLLKMNDGINVPMVFWISVTLTLAALVLRYLVFVYHGYRLPEVSELQLVKPTDDWLKSVDRHREAAT